MGEKLNPKDAAKYLTEHGKPITESKLASLRSTKGAGPEFYKEDDGKYIWCDTDDLDAWNPENKTRQSRPMTKYKSTAEYRKKK
jgi:hypothetical protein